MEPLRPGTQKKKKKAFQGSGIRYGEGCTPEGVIHQARRSHNPSKEPDTEPSTMASSQERDVDKGVREGSPPGTAATNHPLPASASSAAGSPKSSFTSQAGRPFFPYRTKDLQTLTAEGLSEKVRSNGLA